MRPIMKRLDGWAVATIRVFQGGEQALAAAASDALGAAWPQQHGECNGTGPWLLWRSPQERIALASARGQLDALLSAWPPGASASGCALDMSEAVAVWRLQGEALPQVLARLADASALPASGSATRLRWADAAVVLARQSDDEALLLADATLEPYFQQWWAYACEAL